MSCLLIDFPWQKETKREKPILGYTAFELINNLIFFIMYTACMLFLAGLNWEIAGY